jgi:hypothetical protein
MYIDGLTLLVADQNTAATHMNCVVRRDVTVFHVPFTEKHILFNIVPVFYTL